MDQKKFGCFWFILSRVILKKALGVIPTPSPFLTGRVNVGTKILSKSLVLRIKKVLSSLKCSDQTAYVKDRYIGLSVRLIDDVLEFTDYVKIEPMLFSANLEKASDSTDHSFLFSALKGIQNLTRLVTSFLWFKSSIDQAISYNKCKL